MTDDYETDYYERKEKKRLEGCRATAWFMLAFWLAVGMFILFMPEAEAGEKKPMPPSQDQSQRQHQDQAQGQGQAQGQVATGGEATINIGTGGGGADAQSTSGQGALSSNASNDGVTIGGDSVENNSSNVVLVPNNNTENCLRVWGISWGSSSGSGALGIPWRSKKCDYEQAADDAFAAGERELGWFWKCENPNLHKSFKDKGETPDQAKDQCLDKMVGGITAMRVIDDLQEQVAFLKNQQRLEQIRCEESKDQIFRAACMK